MTIAGCIRQHLLARELDGRVAAYRQTPAPDECRVEQLDLFNREWERVRSESPYYCRLSRQQGLPRRFASWQEVSGLLPVTRRATLQSDAAAISCGRPDFFRITGGTTAEPVQVPAWNSELDHTHLDVWVGRNWYGIRPSSRLFLIWGHSHLLGSGMRGWFRARQRECQDWLLGYRRYSAYDMRAEAMRTAAESLLRFRPEYVMGYSVALDRFARVNQSLASGLRSLGVKVVIGAAEGFPSPDSRARIEDLFGCPVAMEYGSVETNLIAHSVPEGGYRGFWRSYYLETLPSARGGRARKILVTSLYPRAVPLIRYEIGDNVLVSDSDRDQPSVTAFEAVAGRSNDFVELTDGATIHSEAFTHAVRGFEQVKGYQVVQRGEDLAIRVLADGPLPTPVQQAIHDKLGRIHRELAEVPVTEVARLETTIAGKTPMILKR